MKPRIIYVNIFFADGHGLFDGQELEDVFEPFFFVRLIGLDSFDLFGGTEDALLIIEQA